MHIDGSKRCPLPPLQGYCLIGFVVICQIQNSARINSQQIISQFVMQGFQYTLFSEQIQALLRGKVETECFLCLGQFDCEEYAPVMMCMNQHTCCGPCMQELIKVEPSKHIACPYCNQPINRRHIVRNRHLMTIFEIVHAFTRQLKQLTEQLENAKKAAITQPKTTLCVRQPTLASSFILFTDKRDSFLQQSTIFEECPTSRSWVGGSEKRKQLLLAYAQRQKSEELKRIAQSDAPLQQISKIRSGYGTIKKIECMDMFTNLKELLLYNNHIKIIEGLSSNTKLNVLSLAYNRIEKAENLAHLKQLKRLSLQCNKLGKSSAEYLAHYQWKNLESLTISFHQEKKEDNQECFSILFTGKSMAQWSNLKSLYIYNSKQIGEGPRGVVREFVGKRKNAMQVYWS